MLDTDCQELLEPKQRCGKVLTMKIQSILIRDVTNKPAWLINTLEKGATKIAQIFMLFLKQSKQNAPRFQPKTSVVQVVYSARDTVSNSYWESYIYVSSQ